MIDPLPINTIYNADTNDFFPRIQENSVNLIIADPPYGINFQGGGYNDTPEYVFTHADLWVQQCARVLKMNSHSYWFIPTEHLIPWGNIINKYLTVKNIIATAVYSNNRFNLKNNFGFNAQYILFAHKGEGKILNDVDWIPTSETWFTDKRNTNAKPFTYIYPNFISDRYCHANSKNNAQRKSNHPNEKNVDLISKLIQLSSNEYDLVLDPFMGSGTTAIAAIRTKRNYIGFELNPHHFETCQTRIKHEYEIINQHHKTCTLDRFFS